MPNAVFADLADARHPHIHDAEQRKTGSAIETRCLLVAAALWNRQPSASLSDRSSRAGNSSAGRGRNQYLFGFARDLHVQMCAVKSSYAYILYWTSEESHLYRVDFDQKLWDLIAEGLRAWRKAITSNAAQVPKSPEVKARKAQIEGRLADIYRMCLQNNDYTWLPSYVDRMP